MVRIFDALFKGRLEPGLESAIDLFQHGQDGYHTFRIPGLVILPGDTILAFCEGRRNSPSDFGDIDVVMKRSEDGGRSWSPLRLVWDAGDLAVQNPCPVFDATTNTVFLHVVVNRRDTHVLSSKDGGRTWSTPRLLPLRKPGWAFTWPCPGHAIQLRSGRLLVPGVFSTDGEEEKIDAYGAFFYYSDDHGTSWVVGHDFGQGMNEFMAAEQGDGKVVSVLRRNRRGTLSSTLWSVSADGGATSTVATEHPGLPSPVCEASIARYSSDPGRLLFSNPASNTLRRNMTLKGSTDGGATWHELKRLYRGRSAYSDIAVLQDRTVCVLFERGVKRYSDKLTFVRLKVDPAW